MLSPHRDLPHLSSLFLLKNFEVRIPQIVRIFGFDIRNKYETQLPLLPLVVSATYPQLNMIWWPLSMICPPSTSIAAEFSSNLCSCTTLSQGSCTAVCLISKSFFIVCIVCPTLQLHLSPNLCPNLCSPPILISFSNYITLFSSWFVSMSESLQSCYPNRFLMITVLTRRCSQFICCQRDSAVTLCDCDSVRNNTWS